MLDREKGIEMARYHEDWNRKLAHDNQKEHGYVFTIEQIRDICDLVKDGRRGPDGSFSDAECNLYEVLYDYFGKKK